MRAQGWAAAAISGSVLLCKTPAEAKVRQTGRINYSRDLGKRLTSTQDLRRSGRSFGKIIGTRQIGQA